MKYILYSLIFVFTFCLKQKLFAQDIDFQKKSLEYDFKNAIHFSIDQSIIADFNGDGVNDTAIFRKENKTSGISINHGKTKETVRIGFGSDFAHLTDFNWVDYWGLVKDSTTYEMLFDETDILGDTNVRLENPSIVVRTMEMEKANPVRLKFESCNDDDCTARIVGGYADGDDGVEVDVFKKFMDFDHVLFLFVYRDGSHKSVSVPLFSFKQQYQSL